MSEYFLHSRETNSFYFRRTDMPNTDMEGFTLTYVKPGYTILTGDMGCLTWQMNELGFDYGFPRTDDDISYFAEKIKLAENQHTRTWNYDQAIEDLKEYIESEEDDTLKLKLQELIENNTWGDCGSAVGQYKMLEDLYETYPHGDWCECDIGETWEYHFKRKFDMVKSVSELVLQAVKEAV